MKSMLFLVAGLLLAVPLMAETYSWVDGQGTVNFTDDYSQIPRQYRNKAKRLESVDVAPSPEVQAPESENSGTANKTLKEAGAKGPAVTVTASPEQVYGDKKAAEWQREFQERNAELERLDAKVKEANEFKKRPPVYGPELVDLNKRLREAVQEYNESVKRYNELNNAANKAGVPAEFRK